MSIKVYKPNTAARRNMSTLGNETLTKKAPEKSLLAPRKQNAGRNNQGRITVRHRGGGAKRKLRIVDYKMSTYKEFTVEAIEYDPNRNANLALITANNKKHYILASVAHKVGSKYMVGEDAAIKPGNRMVLSQIPESTTIHNVEITLGRGGQIVKGAGTKAVLLAKDEKYAQIKLPSGEIRLVLLTCSATIGIVSNPEYSLMRIGSAGRKRHMGFRPTVRGKAMNPVDHPHGGGEGGAPIGLKYPKTPWGKHALGKKTRSRKSTDKFILKDRRAK